MKLGGATVATAGVLVKAGGASIPTAGSIWKQTSTSADTFSVYNSAVSNFANTAALLSTTRAANSGFSFVTATANSAVVFKVDGTGLATTAGGISFSGAPSTITQTNDAETMTVYNTDAT